MEYASEFRYRNPIINEDDVVIAISQSGETADTLAAIKLAKEMGPGHNIVTILCDDGRRYASKIYNKDFLKDKNLPIPKWL